MKSEFKTYTSLGCSIGMSPDDVLELYPESKSAVWARAVIDGTINDLLAEVEALQ